MDGRIRTLFNRIKPSSKLQMIGIFTIPLFTFLDCFTTYLWFGSFPKNEFNFFNNFGIPILETVPFNIIYLFIVISITNYFVQDIQIRDIIMIMPSVMCSLAIIFNYLYFIKIVSGGLLIFIIHMTLMGLIPYTLVKIKMKYWKKIT